MKCAIPFVLAACWLGVIFYLSSQNGTQTASLSLGITDVLLGLLERLNIVLNPERFHLWLRTLAHVAVFWLEGVLLWWSFRGVTSTRLRAAAVALLVSIPLCALDELHKLMIPGRHCQWDEAALNLLGAALGIALCLAAGAIGDAVRRSKRL